MEKKNLKRFAVIKHSDSFYNQFQQNTSARYVVCEACSREHFVTNEAMWADDRDGLRRLKLQNRFNDSEKFICRGDCNTIEYAFYIGIQFVFSCPCNFARSIENFLQNERSAIQIFYEKPNHEKSVSVLDVDITVIKGIPKAVTKFCRDRELKTLDALLQISFEDAMHAKNFGGRSHGKLRNLLIALGVKGITNYPLFKRPVTRGDILNQWKISMISMNE